VVKYYEHFFHIKNAIAWEKQIKGWSRKKKEALFKEDFEKVKKFSKSKQLRISKDPSPGSG
jgi:putative endonuclease